MLNLSEALYNKTLSIYRRSAYMTAARDQQGLRWEGIPMALRPSSLPSKGLTVPWPSGSTMAYLKSQCDNITT